MLSTTLLLIGLQGAFDESAVHARPNVILIMTDDQGYGDLGITGNSCLETPHLDALGRQSARWRRFYVSPVCSPTRACLMTGRYAYRTRVVDTWVGRSMMDPGEHTLAELLRATGYHTGIFGKWHLGDHFPLRPHDQGFDRSLVHFGGGLAQPSEPPENERRYTDPILSRNGNEELAEGYCTDVYFDEALAFVDEVRGSDRPFFVYLPTNAPHGPLHDVPSELYEKYAGMDLGPVLGASGKADRTARIYAMIENVDQNVGRLMDRLDQWGLAENTLVVFLLDNGPQGVRYNAGLRGQKTHVYEGGVRSVFFARWPARLRAHDVGEHPAAHIDVLPTILEAAGVQHDPARSLDGRSLLTSLERGSDPTWSPRTLFLQVHRGNTPQRGWHFAAIGPRYKLVRNSGFGGRGVKDPSEMPLELYDLVDDPGESHDLSAQLPGVVGSMWTQYLRWFADVSSERPDNYSPPRIVIGEDAETFTRLSKQDWRVGDAEGWGQVGAWHLRSGKSRRYDIQILFHPPVAGELQLLVGTEVLARLDCAPGTRDATISDQELPAGDFGLRVVVRGDKAQGAYQVLLRRK